MADVVDDNGPCLGPEMIPDEVQLCDGPFVSPVAHRDGFWAPAIHDLGHPQVVRFRLEPSQGM